MDHGGGASGPVPSLHDDFLQTLHDTGMYGYAENIDLVQDGNISEVRMHEDMRMWPMDDNFAPAVRQGLSDEELREGDLRIEAANAASEQAISAAEEVKARQRVSLEADPLDDLATSTPGKHRKLKKGTKGASEYGGRSNNKGLRHFSMKVCEKVEGKGRTTYNEVADELVNDLPGQHDPVGSPGGMQYDEKNIRRRVYDALNVLMAMGIISRERKEIFWKGLPQGPQLSLDRLRGEKHRLCQKLDQQRRYIAELTQQQATYRALMSRNRGQTLEQLNESNAAGNTQLTALALPFVLIQVDRNATVEIKISEDNRVAHFDFEGMPFKFTGDEQVLQEMGLASMDDPLTARAYAAAGEASSPRPAAQQNAARQGAPGPSNSRAHPALPSPPPPPIMAPLQPIMQSPKGYLGQPPPLGSPPTSAPNGTPNGLGLLGSVAAAAGGMSPAWGSARPGMQQAALMQHMQQAALQQRGLGMPMSPNTARPLGNQQIPGAQPYRSPQQSTPTHHLPQMTQISPRLLGPGMQPGMQLTSPVSRPFPGMPPHSYANVATSVPGSAGKSILSMPMGPNHSQGLASAAEWARLDPATNHARLLHSAPGAQMLPNIQPLHTQHQQPQMMFPGQPGMLMRPPNPNPSMNSGPMNSSPSPNAIPNTNPNANPNPDPSKKQ